MKVEIQIEIEFHGNPYGAGEGKCTLTCNGATRQQGARAEGVTRNALEIGMIANACKMLNRPCEVVIYTDNPYIRNCVNNGWLESWNKNGWKRAQGKVLANRELWETLYKVLIKHKVRVERRKV